MELKVKQGHYEAGGQTEVKISNLVIYDPNPTFSTPKCYKYKINIGNIYDFSGLEVKQGSFEARGQMEVEICNFVISDPNPMVSTQNDKIKNK